MKSILTSEKFKKLIIVLFVITTLGNFMPKATYAGTDLEAGGVILAPISIFTTFVCDKLMNWLQTSFVTTDSISPKDGSGEYNFRYSPAIIFSGNVPALSINFINPPDTEKETKKVTEETVLEDDSYEMASADKKDEYEKITAESLAAKYSYTKENETRNETDTTTGRSRTILEWKLNENENYKCEFDIISPTSNASRSQ